MKKLLRRIKSKLSAKRLREEAFQISLDQAKASIMPALYGQFRMGEQIAFSSVADSRPALPIISLEDKDLQSYYELYTSVRDQRDNLGKAVSLAARLEDLCHIAELKLYGGTAGTNPLSYRRIERIPKCGMMITADNPARLCGKPPVAKWVHEGKVVPCCAIHDMALTQHYMEKGRNDKPSKPILDDGAARNGGIELGATGSGTFTTHNPTMFTLDADGYIRGH